LSLTENRQARSCLTESLNELADAPMAELTRADLVRFRNELAARGLGQRTVNNRLGIVRSLFKAVQRDVCNRGRTANMPSVAIGARLPATDDLSEHTLSDLFRSDQLSYDSMH